LNAPGRELFFRAVGLNVMDACVQNGWVMLSGKPPRIGAATVFQTALRGEFRTTVQRLLGNVRGYDVHSWPELYGEDV